MPTYQYACTECEHAFEQVQSFSDDALTTCPECTGRLRKIFNAVGVVFKGSGFYRTDSRSSTSSSSGGDSSTSGATKGSGSPAGSSSGSGSDSSSGSSAGSSSSAGSASTSSAGAAAAS